MARMDHKRAPRAWAVAKGLLRLTSSGAADYSRGAPVPWLWEATERMCRWPNPAQDPTFELTEAEFDTATNACLSLTGRVE